MSDHYTDHDDSDTEPASRTFYWVVTGLCWLIVAVMAAAGVYYLLQDDYFQFGGFTLFAVITWLVMYRPRWFMRVLGFLANFGRP
jgi:hypothetical protein